MFYKNTKYNLMKKQHQNIPLVMVLTVGKIALTNSILGIVCA